MNLKKALNENIIIFIAITAIPRIVCDALKTMELIDKPPSWTIKDDKGNVTVVLQWDQRDRFKKGGDYGEPSSWRVEVVTSQPSETHAQYSSSVKSSSVSSTATSRAKLSLDGLQQRPITRTLPFRTLSTEEEDEDFDKLDQFSPTHDRDHDHSLCDFHCSALHRGGGSISVSISCSDWIALSLYLLCFVFLFLIIRYQRFSKLIFFNLIMV